MCTISDLCTRIARHVKKFINCSNAAPVDAVAYRRIVKPDLTKLSTAAVCECGDV